MTRKPPLPRLDELLVDRGLAGDLRQAGGWIMVGDVLVDDAVETKPGRRVAIDASIRLRREPRPFASRAGVKLARALDAFAIDVTGRVALDAGASAGGFTDVLLQRGARKVYAADVGYGQMDGRLANDPRVVNLERTNISDLRAEHFAAAPPELCSVDLSYLSLRVAVPVLCAAAPSIREMICLVKPLFEGLEQRRLDDPAALGPILLALVPALETPKLRALGLRASPVLGGRGAVELLLHLGQGEPFALEQAISAAITEVMASGLLRSSS